MAILEKIRENIGTAGQITADIAKRTAEALRLREQIRQDKKEIRKLTYEIGQTYLRLHADDYEEVYKEFVDGIAAAKTDMEEKRTQLAQLREKPVDAEDDIMTVDDDEWDDLFENEAANVDTPVQEPAAKETAAEAASEAIELETEAAKEGQPEE